MIEYYLKLDSKDSSLELLDVPNFIEQPMNTVTIFYLDYPVVISKNCIYSFTTDLKYLETIKPNKLIKFYLDSKLVFGIFKEYTKFGLIIQKDTEYLLVPKSDIHSYEI